MQRHTDPNPKISQVDPAWWTDTPARGRMVPGPIHQVEDLCPMPNNNNQDYVPFGDLWYLRNVAFQFQQNSFQIRAKVQQSEWPPDLHEKLQAVGTVQVFTFPELQTHWFWTASHPHIWVPSRVPARFDMNWTLTQPLLDAIHALMLLYTTDFVLGSQLMWVYNSVSTGMIWRSGQPAK